MIISTILKNLAIIGAIVGVAFLSQQPWTTSNNTNYTYSKGVNSVNNGLKGVGDWFNQATQKVRSVGSGGAALGTSTIDTAKSEIENQKNNFLQNASDTSREFVAKQVLNVLHVAPQDLAQCPAK